MAEGLILSAIIDKMRRRDCARTATVHMIQCGFTLISFTVVRVVPEGARTGGAGAIESCSACGGGRSQKIAA